MLSLCKSFFLASLKNRLYIAHMIIGMTIATCFLVGGFAAFMYLKKGAM